ncbi:MAG: carboxymuconolactone decarboxylase family protein [Methanobacteriaceae archaeon]
MKEDVFYGKGMGLIKKEYPELFDAISGLNEAVYTGKALDYKAQKLIAIGITASNSDDRAARMQMKSGMEELGISKEEIMDALRIVLLTSGMPPFIKAVKILGNL